MIKFFRKIRQRLLRSTPTEFGVGGVLRYYKHFIPPLRDCAIGSDESAISVQNSGSQF
jgi:hypothetical protein